MTAIGLLKGNLIAQDYEDETANDPRVDMLRDTMVCEENRQFSKDYLDPDKRSIANAIQIFYKDGTVSPQITVEYPIGHKRRRHEGIPKLVDKFKVNLARELNKDKVTTILEISMDQKKLETMPVNSYVDLFWKG